EVLGPRFSLDPTSISSVFPPADQLGTYQNVQPHVVFTEFALPWSRRLDPSSGPGDGAEDAPPPWLGLLMVYPDELAGVTAPRTVTVEELVSPGPGIVPPDLGDTVDPTSQEPVAVVDVDDALFKSIAPYLDELPFLAHARVVNTDGKVLLGMAADGAFSLVTGNRVPMVSADGPSIHTMLLVSYEGHQDHLPTPGGSGGAGGEKIRLVLLGSWTFTTPATSISGSFLGLTQALCNPGNGGVGLLQLPQAGDISGNAVAEEALQIGYVPLQKRLRDGETSTTWYRGPATPSPTERDRTYGPYHSSDHALHYDPATGLFDDSYACAWQIGRLLALSDAGFAQQLFEWRRDYLRELARIILDADFRAPMVETLTRPAGARTVERPGATGSFTSALRELFAAMPEGVLPQIPKSPPRGRRPSTSGLPGALPSDRLSAWADGGDDPLDLLLDHLQSPENR
ncbi:MAG: hypothetical protein AAGD06_15025, partial [Acidobacteriota bacterium]